MVDCPRHRRHHVCSPPQLAPRPSPLAPHPSPSQAAPLDQLHAEEVLAFVFADLVDRHDVRMVQVARCLGFSMKTLHVR